MSWSTILGLVLVLYAVYVIYKGRISSSDENRVGGWVTRAEHPVQYWFSVILMLVLAGLMIFNVIHF